MSVAIAIRISSPPSRNVDHTVTKMLFHQAGGPVSHLARVRPWHMVTLVTVKEFSPFPLVWLQTWAGTQRHQVIVIDASPRDLQKIGQALQDLQWQPQPRFGIATPEDVDDDRDVIFGIASPLATTMWVGVPGRGFALVQQPVAAWPTQATSTSSIEWVTSLARWLLHAPRDSSIDTFLSLVKLSPGVEQQKPELCDLLAVFFLLQGDIDPRRLYGREIVLLRQHDYLSVGHALRQGEKNFGLPLLAVIAALLAWRLDANRSAPTAVLQRMWENGSEYWEETVTAIELSTAKGGRDGLRFPAIRDWSRYEQHVYNNDRGGGAGFRDSPTSSSMGVSPPPPSQTTGGGGILLRKSTSAAGQGVRDRVIEAIYRLGLGVDYTFPDTLCRKVAVAELSIRMTHYIKSHHRSPNVTSNPDGPQ